MSSSSTQTVGLATEPPRELAGRPIACFDLDGTLVTGDTLLPFLVSYAIRSRQWWLLAAMPLRLAGLTLRMASAKKAKQSLLAMFFGGRHEAEIQEHAEWFCRTWVERHLNAPVIEKLRHHQACQHRVIVVSASPDIYVPVIARHLGIGETICTQVERQGGLCGARIIGDNCKGQHKVRAIQDYLGVQKLRVPSYAYGDSDADLPMLRFVEHGQMIKTVGRRAAWLLATACFGIWLAIVVMALPRMAMYSWDSAAYAESAQSIVAGNGLMHRAIAGVEPPLWVPLALWPPGYPLLMASVHALGVSAPVAGVVVSLISGAVFVILAAWICRRVVHWIIAMPLALAITIMPAVYQVSTNCLSDAAYMALAAASLACVVAWTRRPRDSLGLLLAAGALAGAAWSVRNIGVALMAVTGAFLLMHLIWHDWRSVGRCIAAWVVGVVVVATPVVIRNVVTFGKLNPYTMPPSDLSLSQNVQATVVTLAQDLTASRNIAAMLSRPVVLATFVLLAAVAVWMQRRQISLERLKQYLHERRAAILLLGYAAAFIAVLVAARTKYWWGETIYWRYLIPVYWCVLIGLVAIAADLLRGLRLSRTMSSAVVAAGLLVMVALQARAQMTWFDIPPSQQGSIVATVGPNAAEYLQSAVPADQIVLACRADLLRLHCDINARKIPGKPFSDFEYQRAVAREDVIRGGQSGLLWGVVIDDVAGARGGNYGPLVQHLAMNGDEFPELKQLAVEGPALVFRYQGVAR